MSAFAFACGVEGKGKGWLADHEAKACLRCKRTFTFVQRRHHCRFCKLIYCRSCCSHYMNEERACQGCFALRNPSGLPPSHQAVRPLAVLIKHPRYRVQVLAVAAILENIRDRPWSYDLFAATGAFDIVRDIRPSSTGELAEKVQMLMLHVDQGRNGQNQGGGSKQRGTLLRAGEKDFSGEVALIESIGMEAMRAQESYLKESKEAAVYGRRRSEATENYYNTLADCMDRLDGVEGNEHVKNARRNEARKIQMLMNGLGAE